MLNIYTKVLFTYLFNLTEQNFVQNFEWMKQDKHFVESFECMKLYISDYKKSYKIVKPTAFRIFGKLETMQIYARTCQDYFFIKIFPLVTWHVQYKI
jgi:hypothetical protein